MVFDSAVKQENHSPIFQAREGRTTLIIAHRLSTIRDVDKIHAISDGAVVEEGTHDELMGIEDGLYRSLVTYQQSVQVCLRF